MIELFWMMIKSVFISALGFAGVVVVLGVVILGIHTFVLLIKKGAV